MMSCERRPLYEGDEAALLKVHLVTEGIHNVTCDIYNEQLERQRITSDMLRVFIYDKSGSPLLSQGFVSNKSVDERGYETLSGPVMVSPGTYGIVSYNFDVADIHIADEGDFRKIWAYTDEIPATIYSRFGSRSKAMGAVYYAPEHLMVASNPGLVVNAHQGLKTLEMDAHSVVDSYYIQIRITGAENMAEKAAGLAVLSGLSPGCLIGEGKPVEEPVSVYFEMKKSIDPRIEDENQAVLCAVFNTFGRLEDMLSDLKITLSVLSRNGETHQKEIDMTPIFNTEDARKRHWLLIDDVWDIPEPVNDGGFSPKVDSWDDIEEEIHIN